MSLSGANSGEQSIFGSAPAGWAVDRIRDRIGRIVGGEWGDDPDEHDEGIVIPVVRVADIRGLDLETDSLTLRRVKLTKLPGRLIGDRTILLEKSGGGEQKTVGRAVLGRRLAVDAIFSNFMAKTDCGPTLNPAFVAYLLGAAYSAGVNTAHIQQTTGIQNLRVADYLNTKVAIPPLPEQQKIVLHLDETCAAIDSAVDAKREQIRALDGVRIDVIQQAVTRGLADKPALRETNDVWFPRIPCTWELVSLKRVSETQTGLTLGKVYEGALIERPYLRVANVQDGHVDLTDVTTIEVPADVASRVELSPGDVLMTEGGDLDKLGRGTVWNGEIAGCLHQNHVFAIRCFKHKLLPEFLAYLTASSYGRGYFEATGKKTTNLASTNSTKVGLFPIPRPEIDEQRAICQYLDRELSKLGRVAAVIEAQVATLGAYRKSLIHECVTGQRRVGHVMAERVLAHG